MCIQVQILAEITLISKSVYSFNILHIRYSDHELGLIFSGRPLLQHDLLLVSSPVHEFLHLGFQSCSQSQVVNSEPGTVEVIGNSEGLFHESTWAAFGHSCFGGTASCVHARDAENLITSKLRATPRYHKYCNSPLFHRIIMVHLHALL